MDTIACHNYQCISTKPNGEIQRGERGYLED